MQVNQSYNTGGDSNGQPTTRQLQRASQLGGHPGLQTSTTPASVPARRAPRVQNLVNPSERPSQAGTLGTHIRLSRHSSCNRRAYARQSAIQHRWGFEWPANNQTIPASFPDLRAPWTKLNGTLFGTGFGLYRSPRGIRILSFPLLAVDQSIFGNHATSSDNDHMTSNWSWEVVVGYRHIYCRRYLGDHRRHVSFGKHTLSTWCLRTPSAYINLQLHSFNMVLERTPFTTTIYYYLRC
jgi:hypothetical protein